MDFTNFQLKSANKITSLNAYCSDDFSNELLGRYGEILKEKGINLNIFKVSASELEAAVRNSKADIWIERVEDGSTCSKYEYYNSVGEKNLSGFSNADIDNLTEKIRSSVGMYDRSQLTEKMLESVAAQAVEQPVCQLQNVTVYNLNSISESSFDADYNFDDFTFYIEYLNIK